MGKNAKFFTNAYGQARGGQPDRKIFVCFTTFLNIFLFLGSLYTFKKAAFKQILANLLVWCNPIELLVLNNIPLTLKRSKRKGGKRRFMSQTCTN